MAQVRLLLLFSLALCPVLIAMENDAPLTNEPIPPLPPEELEKRETVEIAEKSPLVVNMDDAMSKGFFANTKVNTGSSRYLNALDLQGYFRTRFSYFRNPHL